MPGPFVSRTLGQVLRTDCSGMANVFYVSRRFRTLIKRVFQTAFRNGEFPRFGRIKYVLTRFERFFVFVFVTASRTIPHVSQRIRHTLAEQRTEHTRRGWRGIHKLKNKRFVRIYRVISRLPTYAKFDFRTSSETSDRFGRVRR